MNKKNNLVVIVLALLAIALGYNYFYLKSDRRVEKPISYTELVNKVEASGIKRVSINNNIVKSEDQEGNIYITAIPMNDNEFMKVLKEKDVNISVALPTTGKSGLSVFIYIGLGLLLVYWLFKSTKGGENQGGNAGGAFGFGKSKAKLLNPKDSTITFADVAGIDEAKDDLQEIVDFLKDSKKFQVLGAKIPRGCLLVGSPGTGKTLLAKAVAGEAKVPFFSISGSDFVEMFVGVGASRVRDLFAQAKKHAPCIVFIDEIDAVGRQRGVGVGGGNDEREQTLNQLLVEMDGFTPNQGVIIIAATNRPDVLDPALLRPGRFDRQVVVPLPDIVGRERILQIYLAKIPLSKNIDINMIARGTTGFSGAEIANLVNEAALAAARNNKTSVDMEEFELARDKIMMGAERKSTKLTLEDRTLTAYHEAGHALVAFKIGDYYPVHKVTIVPRGRSMGVTAFLPEREEYNRSYQQLTNQLAVAFGGRVAEEIIFGKPNVTTGAAMDIQMATNIAKKMISEWGFSDKIGRVRYAENDKGYFPTRSTSELTSREIEEEIKVMTFAGEEKAREILTQYSKELKLLSEALLEHEILTGEEALRICNGKDIKTIKSPQIEGVNKGRFSGTKIELSGDSSVPVVD
ncbi:ATP-dependent zinc metalloprotease FtsH [Candidatus Hepatincolaceae symbiont of Richtersius coronifer]